MEQPPGSVDDLQPQDLSTSSIPTVIDLTRKGEECVLSNTSFNALHMVKSPVWYPDPETGSSDTTIPSGDPVQPDNAFSHTTVTLSYVSRSRVFSSHDSVSLCSPRYGVPPISRLSLHPPCDLDKGLGETGYALNQHYLEQVDGPMDLACQTELFQAQVGSENDGGVCPKLEPQELNGGVISSEGDMDKHVKGKEEHRLSQEKSVGLENGQGDSCSSSGICAESSPETLSSATGKDEERDGTEVLFLMSKKQDNMGARDLSSLSREYISPLEDPVSPSATSLDNVEDVFILPQASSSPSGDNSCLEATEEVAWDGMRTDRTVQPGSDISSSTTRLGSSGEHEQPVQRQKAVLDPLICLTDDVCVTDVSENQPKPVVPHMNGNTKALQRTLKKKKLPVRSGRGTRLEAIVMNINSSRYKVSGCIRTSKKETASKSTASEEKLASPERNDVLSVGERKSRAKARFLVKTMKQKAMNRHKANNINTDSTSDSELSNTQKTNGRTPPKSPAHSKSVREPEDDSHPEYSPQISPVKSKRKPSSVSRPQPEPEHLPHPEPSAGRSSSPLQSSQSPKKSKGKATGSKTPPTAKRKRAHKRRQKKAKWSPPSSMFSPKEPEIKLKYVNYKEERRDMRFDSFSPFIRVERQQSWSPLCTVVNYPEEVRTQEKKGPPCGLTSAAVPSTSCLQLGRVSMHGQHQRALVCCLCGQAANAMDLGDLHGPYYPEGYQLSTKTPASMSDLKEEEDDYSDSNSSSCSFRGRRRKCAVPPRAPRPQGLKQRGLVGGHSWTAVSCSSPAAKRARSDAGSADVEDWYSPPLLPLEPCEYWLHEDCAIWSAGVFLVKGRVYGLEEAVKVAQETMCSACSDGGASLGCFFKACPNKYHYRCALESDCVLIEDNFSMKCKKHKNKTLKASVGSRWDDR